MEIGVTTSCRILLARLFSVLPALALALGLIAAAPSASAQRSVAPEAEVCKNCHADYVAVYMQTKHGQSGNARGPDCLTCHGQNALEHAKLGGGKGVGGIFSFTDKNVEPGKKTAVCLTCHQGGNRIHWDRSSHAGAEVACTSCHQLHVQHDKVRDKMTQTEVCFACHKTQRAEMRRPSRHPIDEGKVVCSDCHNPHGTAGPKMLVRDNVNDTCYTCHMEKRGPFVRTHEPVQEDCTICHNPHGTTNPTLLKVRAPFLCQSCHQGSSHHSTVPDATGAPSMGTAVVMARGCLNCHTNIHGTNNPAADGAGRGFRR
jgi:DmsE family decaheme c-type cytochrome